MTDPGHDVIGTRKGLLEAITSQMEEEFSGNKAWARIKILREDLSSDLWRSITSDLSELHPYSDITRHHGICDSSEPPIKIGSLNFYKEAKGSTGDRNYLCGFKVCLSQCSDFMFWSVPRWSAEDVFDAISDEIEQQQRGKR